MREGTNQCKAFMDNIRCCKLPSEYDDFATHHFGYTNAFLIHCKRVQVHIKQSLDKLLKQQQKDYKAKKCQQLRTECYSRSAYKIVAGRNTKSIAILKDELGRLVSSPVQIDQMVRDSWAKIYQGKVTNVAQHITSHLTKYSRFLFVQPSVQVPDITIEDIRNTSSAYALTASGPDGWNPADLHSLSDNAFTWL